MTTVEGAKSVGVVSLGKARTAARAVRRGCHLAAGTSGGKVGLLLLLPIAGVVLFGPNLAPHGITEVVGRPFSAVSADHLLGTDYLGRDVLSRFLNGGRTLILASLVAPLITVTIGGLVGILAGSRGGRLDTVVIWLVDVLLSIPALIFALLILAAFGANLWATFGALSVILLPGCIRITRAATLDAASSEYVEAALARGEGGFAIAVREILPNIRSVIAADFGLRVGYAALTYAGLSFLGFGEPPPLPDWGGMVSENRGGVMVQPLAVLVPSVAIAMFTVATMEIADSIARSLGRSGSN